MPPHPPRGGITIIIMSIVKECCIHEHVPLSRDLLPCQAHCLHSNWYVDFTGQNVVPTPSTKYSYILFCMPRHPYNTHMLASAEWPICMQTIDWLPTENPEKFWLLIDNRVIDTLNLDTLLYVSIVRGTVGVTRGFPLSCQVHCLQSNCLHEKACMLITQTVSS